ncbi:MAG: ATP-binding cassette domain-containing protein [Bacteroidaceae bacterium]|nr:ATP-binding cassette domain-containing protein [Bacteroidaceae bacterium]
MIQVDHISKTFDDGSAALSDVSASFRDGIVNLIIGRSGAGKTVLLKCLVGLLKPDEGHVLYDGRDFFALQRKELSQLRREIGMLFQGSALFDSMNVLDNVMFPLVMFSDGSRKEHKTRAEECLERVGMQEALAKMPSELSGGMQKRVAIARAIVLNPRYLFCDEPNSGLDPVSSLIIDELISSITHELGMTTIVNTHDMNSVFGIGENILFIHEGRASWSGTKEELRHSGNTQLEEFIMPAFRLAEMGR